MAQVTEAFVRDMLNIVKPDGSGNHMPTTTWEEAQLLHAWLELQQWRANCTGRHGSQTPCFEREIAATSNDSVCPHCIYGAEHTLEHEGKP